MKTILNEGSVELGELSPLQPKEYFFSDELLIFFMFFTALENPILMALAARSTGPGVQDLLLSLRMKYIRWYLM